MDARMRRWLAGGMLGGVLALGVGGAPHLRAGEAPPPGDTQAQKLLDQQAAEEKKLREEVQSQAQAHLVSGKRLLAAFEYEAARAELARALSLDQSNEEARKLVLEVNDLLNRRLDRIRSAIGSLAAAQRVAVQQRLVQLDSRLDWGMRFAAQAAEEPELTPGERIRRNRQAEEFFERALEMVKWMPPAVNVDEQRNQATRMIGELRKSRKALEVALSEQDRQSAQERAVAQMTKEKEFEERRVNMQLDQAKALSEVGEYEKAAALAAKILEADPTNADAHALELISLDRMHIKKKAWIEEERNDQFERCIELADRNGIPHQQYLIYPSNWSEIAQRTGEVSRSRVEEPWKADIRRRLSRRVTFEFVDAPLQEALNFLQSLSKVNIVLDPKAAAGGAAQLKVTLRVTDMDMETALRWILRLADLEFDLRNQAVFITTKANLAAGVELEIYDVRDLTATITDFPAPRIELSANATGQPGGAGGGAGVTFVQPTAVPTVTAPDLAALIKDTLMPAEFADPATSIEEQGGKLVVMQRPEVHEKIRQILQSFRETQAVQVLTQVRFIDAIDGFLEQIGVDFAGLDAAQGDPGLAGSGGTPLTTQGGIGSQYGLWPMGGGAGLPLAFGLAPALTPRQFQQTTIPNSAIQPRLDNNFPGPTFGNPGSMAYGSVGARLQHGASQLLQGMTANVVNNLGGSGPLAGGLTSTALGIQGALFQFRILGNIQASAILHAIRKDQTQDLLIAAKLTQFNNQRAHILVAQQRSYIADYDISGTTWDPIIRALTTGVVLEIKPTVSHDRRYITMDLRPGVAKLIDIQIRFIGGAVLLPIYLPEIELQFVNTTVTVPDQGTLLFSGLINDRKFDTKSGIPLLSDLPVVGRIFGTNLKQRERRNLLILVNSRVILFNEEEEKL